jgi:hypothetical protein
MSLKLVLLPRNRALRSVCFPGSFAATIHAAVVITQLQQLSIEYQATGNPFLIARHLDALFEKLRGRDEVGPGYDDEESNENEDVTPGNKMGSDSSEDDTDEEDGKPTKWRQIYRISKICMTFTTDYNHHNIDKSGTELGGIVLYHI